MSDHSRLFGTDGIRGRVPQWPLTADFMVRLGQTLSGMAQESGAPSMAVIGRDTRSSGPMLEAALAAGLMERGLDVLSLGIIPTPAVAFLVRHFGAGLGIVISASHNPHPDNGIKLFSSTGFKFPPEIERDIERRIREVQAITWSGHLRIGQRAQSEIPPGEAYLQALLNRSGRPKPLQGWHLVLDCAHGSAFELAPQLFRRLGAELTVLCAHPDGENINQNCGSEHPALLREEVLHRGADAGIAFDGDADRVLLIDEQGDLLDGDDLLHILARDLYSRGQLRHNTVVGTVVSNLGLEQSLQAMGGLLERVPVGDRQVARRMLEGDFVLGGEPSGHIILFGEGSTTGDGLYTAMRVLGVAVRRKQPLSALAKLNKTPQVTINVPVPRKPPLESLPEIQRVRVAVEERLGSEGRLLLRYSGTQALLRIIVEGNNEEQIHWAAQALAETAQRVLSRPQSPDAAPVEADAAEDGPN
ncbi:MAG: phosphoglucosamine mutase [Chloroflexia bacterium]|nr:phosphoglucosamine mutase [Chloroflexia bacterium]